MASGTLPKPGKIVRGEKIGPCVNPCSHTDCAEVRRMAAAQCNVCGAPIGYETRFYYAESLEGQFIHAKCC